MTSGEFRSPNQFIHSVIWRFINIGGLLTDICFNEIVEFEINITQCILHQKSHKIHTNKIVEDMALQYQRHFYLANGGVLDTPRTFSF
jgi:hypothetical protein